MTAPTTRELTSAPGLPGLYLRALLPGGGTGTELPAERLVLRDQLPDEARVRRYAEVCGFGRRDRLPATYPHLVAFGPAMALMTRRDFPFPLLGLVHVANTVEQVRPLRVGVPLTYQVWAEALRPHPKGTVFDVRAEADDGTAVVWRSTSTYLRRGAGAAAGAGSAGAAEEPPLEPVREDLWQVPGSVGRAYAAVSGDRNPIHLHPLTARAFGFRRAIAHGMWSAARCLAALEEELPGAFRVEVAFRAPILLPAAVRFAAQPVGEGWRFALEGADTGRTHLRATLT